MGISTAFCGEHGNLQWTSGQSGMENVFAFSLTESAPALDTTIFSPLSGYTEAVYGLNTITGSVSCYINPAVGYPTGTRTFASGIFETYSGNSSSGSWSGKWLITRATSTVPVNGVNTVTFDVQSTGPIVKN
jgi:hypothetical protein